MPKPTRKPARKTTWREKLERPHPSHGKIVQTPPTMRKSCGAGTLLIPRPLDVDAVMKKVRKGRLITTGQIRAALAKAAGAHAACPLTTGIFTRIVAEAACEDVKAGMRRITPWWRTVRDDGSLHPKFPGATAAQARLLRAEGHTIVPGRGKQPPRIQGFEPS